VRQWRGGWLSEQGAAVKAASRSNGITDEDERAPDGPAVGGVA
jgi:hypothetical protein